MNQRAGSLKDKQDWQTFNQTPQEKKSENPTRQNKKRKRSSN